MANQDARDWFVMILVAGVWIASTVFLFKNPVTTNFMTWSGVCATMTGVFHFLCVHDDKQQDCR